MLMAWHQRAKLENKFFAAMRDKEAVESERKNLARNVEKQVKALEKLSASEKALHAQIVRVQDPYSIQCAETTTGRA